MICKHLQVGDSIMKERRHHKLRQSRGCILAALRLGNHALAAKVIEDRFKNGSLQPCSVFQGIKGNRARGADQGSKNLVLLRNAGGNQL